MADALSALFCLEITSNEFTLPAGRWVVDGERVLFVEESDSIPVQRFISITLEMRDITVKAIAVAVAAAPGTSVQLEQTVAVVIRFDRAGGNNNYQWTCRLFIGLKPGFQ